MAEQFRSSEAYRKRAGDYILGRMSVTERERAERDLEVDVAFRDAVMELAETLHVFDRASAPDAPPDRRWQAIAARITELPHMRQAGLGGTARPRIDTAPRTIGMSLHALPSRRALVVALGLAVAFALGYLAGRL
jgi:anti-sigma-K factor RskA